LSTLDLVYRRTAAIVVFTILKKSTNDPTVINWMLTFVIGLSFFIGIAFTKRRYTARIARIAEILASPQLEPISWLYDHVCTHLRDLDFA
jgi:hypothetical protein